MENIKKIIWNFFKYLNFKKIKNYLFNRSFSDLCLVNNLIT